MFIEDHIFPNWGRLRIPPKLEFTSSEVKEIRRKIKDTPYKELFDKFPRFFSPCAASKFLEQPPLIAEPILEEGIKDKVAFKGKDGNAYTGQVDEKNRRNGWGYLLFVDGTMHQGFFYAGDIRGRGRRFDLNGVVLQGDWKGNVLKGEGMIIWPNGVSYEGYIEDGMPHGDGVETTEEYTYNGNFIRGEKDGYGELFWKDGSWYKGMFNIQKIEGEGTYHWANGNEYEGEWFRNKMHGKGVFKWADGRVYKGNFAHGYREGHGKLEWPSGRRYEGYWEKGFYDGIGMEVREDGTTSEGVFVSGQLAQNFDPVIPGSDEELSDDQIDTKELFKQVAPSYEDLLKKANIIRKIKKQPLSDISGSFLEVTEEDFTVEAKKERKQKLIKEIKEKKTQQRDKRLKLRKWETEDPRKACLWDLESPLIDHPIFFKAYSLHNELPPFEYEDPDYEMPFDLNFNEDWKDLGAGKLYKGQMDDNEQAQGMGVLLHKGRIYEGFWRDNKRCGYGRQIGPKGDVYHGYWYDNMRSGFGTYEIKEKNYSYIGDWENDIFHGRGLLVTEEAAYEGDWKENKQHGAGSLVYDDGRVYNGSFKDGVIEGYGSLIWPNGKGYAGQWKNGEMIGIGTKVTRKIKSLYANGLEEFAAKHSFQENSIPESVVSERDIPYEGTTATGGPTTYIDNY
ncbi:unnamed protein product [Blepharisma stoltei]|uniref:Uncharacterized protein n=1 Tax=Blepharisma stoltei TaxID=1481888 RepID=A0AAU9K4N1_9CILI|nr:unnamed protein product [Blepharisma stoltei]